MTPMRSCAVLLAVFAAAAASAPAHAQSSARGASLYTTLGCAASNCHGTNPAANQGRVLRGAGSAIAVEYSIGARADKQYLFNVFATDPAASADIAAYLATITPATPPAPAKTTVVE